MATSEVTKFDSMKLSLFEIVPGNASLDTKIVLSGVGHSRAVVVSVAPGKIFELAAGLLSVCEKIDPQATVRCLQGALSHATSPPAADSAAMSPAVPTEIGARSVGSGVPQSIVDYAKAIQDQGKRSGLSDQVIGELVAYAVMTDDYGDYADSVESNEDSETKTP